MWWNDIVPLAQSYCVSVSRYKQLKILLIIPWLCHDKGICCSKLTRDSLSLCSKSDVKRRNTLGWLDQYTWKVVGVWNIRDRETVLVYKYMKQSGLWSSRGTHGSLVVILWLCISSSGEARKFKSLSPETLILLGKVRNTKYIIKMKQVNTRVSPTDIKTSWHENEFHVTRNLLKKARWCRPMMFSLLLARTTDEQRVERLLKWDVLTRTWCYLDVKLLCLYEIQSLCYR